MKALSIKQIEEGCAKVLENARDLIHDAETLLKAKRYARSYYLAHLACEEMAKIPMLIGAAVDILGGRRFDWTELDRRLHSHTEKIMGILVIDYFTDRKAENDPDIEKLKEDLERTKSYKKLKEHSLYTGLVEGRFKKPSELIHPGLATNLVKLAQDRLGFFESINLPKDGNLEKALESPFFDDLSNQFIEPLRKKMKPRRR
jgi:AbiV family abortive infection protein